MRAMVVGTVAAVTLAAGGASAATTFQADLMVDQLVGYFNGQDPQESFSIVDDVGFSLTGTLPSVDLTGSDNSRSWIYSLPGSIALNFQGSLIEFSGQIMGALEVFYDSNFASTDESYAEVRFSNSFTGFATDGTE